MWQYLAVHPICNTEGALQILQAFTWSLQAMSKVNLEQFSPEVSLQEFELKGSKPGEFDGL